MTGEGAGAGRIELWHEPDWTEELERLGREGRRDYRNALAKEFLERVG